jgi:hypothetical protein
MCKLRKVKVVVDTNRILDYSTLAIDILCDNNTQIQRLNQDLIFKNVLFAHHYNEESATHARVRDSLS